MKLRTQFILTYLLLAVLPLSAIVLYSYRSSKETFRLAVEQDALVMADELQERIGEERLALADRFQVFGELPMSGLGEQSGNFYDVVMEGLGDKAPLLDSVEFVPIAPVEPPLPTPEIGPVPVTPVTPEPPSPPEPETVAETDETIVLAPEVVSDATLESIEGSLDASFEIAEAFVAYFGDEGELEALRDARDHAVGVAIEQVRTQLEHETVQTEIETAIQDQLEEALVLAEERLEHEIDHHVTRIENAQDQLAELDERAAERSERGERAGSQTRKAEARERSRLEAQIADASRAIERASSRQVEDAERIRHAFAKRSALSEEQKTRMAEERKRMKMLLGSEIAVPVTREGKVVGEFRPNIRAEDFLVEVLEATRREQGEVPFAIDVDGGVYTATEVDPGLEAKFQAMADGLDRTSDDRRLRFDEDWVMVALPEPGTGLVLGIARPVRESLDAMRKTSARNLSLGIGLVGLSLIGVLPLSNRLTRDLKQLNIGAQQLARGDLDTRVAIRSGSEVGQLAETFNRMASDLDSNQKRLVYQEVQQRLLEAEHRRKSTELEDARSFQLSLLPKRLPEHPRLDVAVLTHTAAEVGGDYYDFRTDGDVLTTVIGDATGHGARAGTMVAVIKSLITAQESLDDLTAFLTHASGTISRMDLGRMNMALLLARTDGRRLTVAAAGMPPILVHRADGTVEDVTLSGPPLGSMSAPRYQQREVGVAPGDTVLLLTDGLPELPDPDGDPLGYDGVRQLFADSAHLAPDELLAALRDAANAWTGEQRPNDDVTFVVLRIT